ncbi:protein of unknown function [Legionella micdadei]|uniref:Uncharacterized protein n=1 Tax=Legionella micdadei TaxID=451 RepID=A0A098GKZ2_LEGMI|nr:protein of unknown function [Legionella micdadei]
MQMGLNNDDQKHERLDMPLPDKILCFHVNLYDSEFSILSYLTARIIYTYFLLWTCLNLQIAI